MRPTIPNCGGRMATALRNCMKCQYHSIAMEMSSRKLVKCLVLRAGNVRLVTALYILVRDMSRWWGLRGLRESDPPLGYRYLGQ
jgi:hypothetical protein